MKKYKSILVISYILLTCFVLGSLLFISCTKKQEGYKISGKIKGIGNKNILLFEWTGKKDTITTVISVNDEFSFSGKVELPLQYYLQIEGAKSLIPVFVENSEIQIVGDTSDLGNVVITGSESHNIYREFTKSFNDKFAYEKDSLSAAYNKAEQSNNAMLLEEAKAGYGELYKKQKLYIIDFSKKHLNSVVVPYVMLEELIFRASLAELKGLYLQLSPEIVKSKYSKSLAEKIANQENVEVGKPAPEIAQPDTSGTLVRLSSLRGKWVLIDFWSSHCGPCRKENPNLLKVYNKYRAKGFEILANSSDTKKEEWVQAIRKDGLTWLHISSLDRSADKARETYCVEYNPYNLLVNPEGIIVAKELSNKDLEAKLAEIFNAESK